MTSSGPSLAEIQQAEREAALQQQQRDLAAILELQQQNAPTRDGGAAKWLSAARPPLALSLAEIQAAEEKTRQEGQARGKEKREMEPQVGWK